MKILFTAYLLFNALNYVVSQQEFVFDNVLHYETHSYVDNTKEKSAYNKEYQGDFFVMINSKDNSYYSEFRVVKDTLKLFFLDTFKSFASLNYLKDDFIKAETLTYDKKYHRESSYPYIDKTKEYTFLPISDTLIDGKKFQRYLLKHKKPKKIKRKKIGSMVFILDTSYDFLPHLDYYHLPLFWRKNIRLPNSIYKEVHYYNYNNELVWKHIFKEIKDINKKIITPNPL